MFAVEFFNQTSVVIVSDNAIKLTFIKLIHPTTLAVSLNGFRNLCANHHNPVCRRLLLFVPSVFHGIIIGTFNPFFNLFSFYYHNYLYLCLLHHSQQTVPPSLSQQRPSPKASSSVNEIQLPQQGGSLSSFFIKVTFYRFTQ